MKEQIIIAYSTNRDERFQKEFNKHLKKSCGCDVEIIAYQNNSGESLTHVYNNIWSKLSFECIEKSIFVFCHHDIKFKSNGWGKNLLNIFNTSDADIIGVAGTDQFYPHATWWLDANQQFNQKDLWGKVWHTDGKHEWPTNFTTPNKKCAKIQPVKVVDGVFLAFNPSTCLDFDDDFEGFHYYEISFCYRNLIEGRKIYVTETIPLVHESGGKLSEEWEANRQQFIKKYLK